MAEAGGRASFIRSYEIRSGKKTKGPVVFAVVSQPSRREDGD
jgi:hypothetical protein